MKAQAFDVMAELGDTYWWFRARREILCTVIAKYLAPGGSILDYGCGTGTMSRALRERGYRVIAADVSERALAACRAAGLDTLDVRTEDLPEGQVDCVLLGDVLEHVADEGQLLTGLARTMKPGGLLLVTVPAFDFLWSGEDDVSEHFRRYTRAELVAKLRASGYSVRRASYFNMFLLPLVTAVILTKRVFAPRSLGETDVRPLSPWLDECLYRIFVNEKHLLARWSLPLGASILVLARPGAGTRVAP